MKTSAKIAIIFSCTFIPAIVLTACGLYFGYYKPKQEKEAEIRDIFKEYYDNKVAQFTEENKTIGEIDACFLGDSLTDGYDVKTYYPQFKVANRGIGGDTTTGLIKRLKVSAYDINPKVVTVLIGVNNIQNMLNDYEDIVTGLKDNLPNTKIALLSLTSMTKEWGRNNELAKKRNVEIQKYAEKYSCTFVNLYDPLLDPNTNELKEEWTTDGGHFTPAGYEVITSVLTPVLTDLLK